MRSVQAPLLLVLASLALLSSSAVGCSRAAADAGTVDAEERRLLGAIIRQQEARVAEATKLVEAAQNEAIGIRLRQRMLEQYGRPDLAQALELEAERRETELKFQRRRLADEQVALAAYREYAARAGIPSASPPAASAVHAARGTPARGAGAHSDKTR